MPKKKESELPPCGLYRTGKALKENPEEIPSGALLMFHNHSNRGIPMLQMPEENTHNVWTFHKFGPGIEDDDAFIDALQPIREQGFYYLKEAIETPDGTLPRNTLIQLGYDMQANPIFFLPERGTGDNSLEFPDVGYRFEDIDILESLGPSFPLFIQGDEQEDDEHEDGLEPVSGPQLLN